MAMMDLSGIDIIDAVVDVLREARTADIHTTGTRRVGCVEMGERVFSAPAGFAGLSH